MNNKWYKDSVVILLVIMLGMWVLMVTSVILN